jgi:hypothetical protein
MLAALSALLPGGARDLSAAGSPAFLDGRGGATDTVQRPTDAQRHAATSLVLSAQREGCRLLLLRTARPVVLSVLVRTAFGLSGRPATDTYGVTGSSPWRVRTDRRCCRG